ncbi:hypothetical protein QZH41_001124 [Actinostola sp. cb2023]|nr:hypothetical protein QZH41_001124 [Actinostola sp. cb2023]
MAFTISSSTRLLTILTESDGVPGSYFEKDPSNYTVEQLKRWLKCRGLKQSGKRGELIERVSDCISSGNHKVLDSSIDAGKWIALKVIKENNEAQNNVKQATSDVPIAPSAGWNNFQSKDIPPYFNYGHIHHYALESVKTIISNPQQNEEDEDEQGLAHMTDKPLKNARKPDRKRYAISRPPKVPYIPIAKGTLYPDRKRYPISRPQKVPYYSDRKRYAISRPQKVPYIPTAKWYPISRPQKGTPYPGPQKVPYIPTAKGTLYPNRKKGPYIPTAKCTLYPDRKRYPIFRPQKVPYIPTAKSPYIPTAKGTLYPDRKRYTIVPTAKGTIYPDRKKGKYPDVFKTGLGTMQGITAKLELKDGAKPKFCKARPVPYALQPTVEEEYDRLEREGIIERIEYSEWGTPMVHIPKSDGKTRSCGDYSVTLNPSLKVPQYPSSPPRGCLQKACWRQTFQ